MDRVSLEMELKGNSYPGRGIVIGKSGDGNYAVAAYFIIAAARTAATVSLWRTGKGSAPRPLTRRR